MSQKLFNEVSQLATEQRNPTSLLLDESSTEQILTIINQEDKLVSEAVAKEIPHITIVVEEVVSRYQRSGRLIYVGAGTSGRLGILDAAECPPTFGTDPERIIGLMAGGNEAVFRAAEGAEDNPENGKQAVIDLNVTKDDVVIGIAASRRTPFVLGALEEAFSRSAYTVLLTTNPRSSIDFPFLSETICPVVGPEVLMGSTRMKSAVAQKMVLTMITTTAMVRLGKAYENMMVDLKLSNKKLEERAKRIIMIATGLDYSEAAIALERAGGHVKTALVMTLRNVDAAEAKRLLADAGGFVKRALRLNIT